MRETFVLYTSFIRPNNGSKHKSNKKAGHRPMQITTIHGFS